MKTLITIIYATLGVLFLLISGILLQTWTGWTIGFFRPFAFLAGCLIGIFIPWLIRSRHR